MRFWPILKKHIFQFLSARTALINVSSFTTLSQGQIHLVNLMHLETLQVGQIKKQGSISTVLVPNTPNSSITGCNDLIIYQKFVSPKCLSPGKKKCRGIRADKLLTPRRCRCICKLGGTGAMALLLVKPPFCVRPGSAFAPRSLNSAGSQP